MSTDDLYNALVTTAEETPDDWYRYGRQNDVWKRFGYIPFDRCAGTSKAGGSCSSAADCGDTGRELSFTSPLRQRLTIVQSPSAAQTASNVSIVCAGVSSVVSSYLFTLQTASMDADPTSTSQRKPAPTAWRAAWSASRTTPASPATRTSARTTSRSTARREIIRRFARRVSAKGSSGCRDENLWQFFAYPSTIAASDAVARVENILLTTTQSTTSASATCSRIPTRSGARRYAMSAWWKRMGVYRMVGAILVSFDSTCTVIHR